MSARALDLANVNQRAAADPSASVFVVANAGSGKTKVLVDRIARLLLEGSPPSAFLCITYTKAAAAEMQRRLFERLGAWCIAGDAALADSLEELGASRGDLARARRLFALALETPGGLRIQTIHAFCERLLGRFPLEAGVPPGFEIADEARAEALLRQARAAAALAPDAPAAAFRRFAARLAGDALDGLLDRLALQRAGFHRFTEKLQGPMFAEAALRARHGADQDIDALARGFAERHDWAQLREAAALLCNSSANDCRVGERLKAAVDAMTGAPPVQALRACFAFAANSKNEPYKKLTTAPLQRKHGWLDPLLTAFAADCLAAREQFCAIERAEDAVAALALALKLDEAYAQAKDRAGVLDFEDLIERAQTLLLRAEAAPWVLYKLDGGVDHILIDEGQDTSPAQWDLVAPLRAEFFAGSGARARVRTVFAVGDPKQSIYGFQGADPGRFLAESRTLSKQALAAGLKFAGPDLSTSFRSSPEILRVVDATIAPLPLMGAPHGFDAVQHHAARANEPGTVEVWPLAARPPVREANAWDAPVDSDPAASVQALLARQIAARIAGDIEERRAVWERGLRRAMQAGDVLVLVRRRGPLFYELIKAFKAKGLPVAGADRMTLREELAVEDCLALMRVALDPADDLSLACVLKGPWCGLCDDDADIFPLAHGRAPGVTLYARLEANRDSKYEEARKVVGQAIARRGEDAFSFLSWALEGRFAGGETGWSLALSRLGPEAREPLEELLQRALRPADATAPTLQRFLYEIEVDAGQVKRELEAQSGSVRVMTVHGAKGLEAPVVILPDTTAALKDAPENGLIFDADAGPFVSLRAADDDAATQRARAAHAALMLSEHWRLLYVAMTRARDRLIVCGHQLGNLKNGEPDESWRLAIETAVRADPHAVVAETPFGPGWRVGAVEFAPPSAQPAPAAAALPRWCDQTVAGEAAVGAAAPSRLTHVDAALLSPRGDGQRRFRRGRLVHGLMERLPEWAPPDREAAARAWLQRQGADAGEAAAFAGEALRVIGDRRFAEAFGPNSRAEAPIVGAVGGRAVRGIVDRLVVEEARVLVVDFKTDRPAPADAADVPDSYASQLALYRAVLRKVFPGKDVRCALLWTEAPLLMEIPGGRLDAAEAAFAHG